MFKLLTNAFLLILAVSFFTSCNPSAKEQKKEIGLQLWSIRDDMKKDPVATIKAVGEMGYTFVEPAGYSEGKLYGMEPIDFKALCEENGLVILSTHVGHRVPDATSWDETMAWWDQCIDAHVAAGAKYIVQPSMGPVAYSGLEGLKRYCDYFNAVGKKCKEKGIKFGYHNHANEFKEMEGVVIYDYMLDNTDPNLVFYQLDLYWIIEGEKDPLDYFNKYPGRFELWHVKDDAEVGASGKIDFERIFNEAGKSGMKHYIVEVEKYNFTPLESVKKSFDYLNNAEFVKL